MGLMLTSPVRCLNFEKPAKQRSLARLGMFQKERKKERNHSYVIALLSYLLFLLCRFTSISNTAVTANCFCQCSCNVPQKQFHKCFSWKGYAGNISSARLTAHSAPIHTISSHIHSHVHSHRRKKHSLDDHSATLVNNMSQVSLDFVTRLVLFFWSLTSTGWFTYKLEFQQFATVSM